MTVTADIKRLFAQDTQVEKNGEKLIPHPYDMIICNPFIEQVNEEADESGSEVPDVKQLTVRYRQWGDQSNINFVLTNMRFSIAPPTIEQFIKFKVKVDGLQREALQKEIDRKKKLKNLNTEV